jgi:predicted CxxxxCH...CXXCH cytochrome family protein
VSAPHAPKPWLSSLYTHTDTDPANAPVCAQCHRAGSANNPANHPSTPAAAGTPPGCFNNTLCHSEGAAPHALGATWTTPTTSQFHGLTAKQNLSYCQGCHGTPGTTLFNGGSAPTSCQASCHAQAKAHPIRWYQAPQPFPGYVSSHRDSGNQTVACAICHKVDGAGTGQDPNAPSCFSASFNGVNCHSGGPGSAPHPVPFTDPVHYSTTSATFPGTTFPPGCITCHDISAPSTKVGPVCQTCHVAASPLTSLNCTSCHASPPTSLGSAGAAYPNLEGAHAEHIALASAGTPISCDTCHTGLGSRTTAHYDNAKSRVSPGNVAFLATYGAKTGASSFLAGALSCSNVSCHGGQATPNWQTGTLNVNTQCTNCHASGTAQFNSNNSGEHNKHSGYTCTECHDMNVATNNTAGVSNHFKFLSTSAMEGPAKDTFRNTTGSVVYSPGGTPGTGTCTGTCHLQDHSSDNW